MRIVLAAVLDGVHQQFAEGRRDILAGLGRKMRGDLAQEVRGAVGRVDLAAHVQGDPLRPRRDHADVVLPGVGIERLLHQFAQRPGVKRPVQVAEGALPDGV